MKEYDIYKYIDLGYNEFRVNDGDLMEFCYIVCDDVYVFEVLHSKEEVYLTKNEFQFYKSDKDYRLEKVLSKFKSSKYEKMIQIELCIIVYQDNKFWLGTWYEGLEIELSIETVESLIKDLEVK